MAEFPVKDEEIRALRYDVLRALGASRHPKEAITTVAGNRGLKVDDVQALVSGYGWPDPDKMRIRAQQMEGKTPTPAAMPQPRPADPLQVLLGMAAKSTRARTVKLGARAQALVTELRGLVEAEAAERQAAAKEAERKTRLQAEVKELEEQLTKKREALRGSRRPPSRPYVERSGIKDANAQIREWAAGKGITLNGHGRIPAAVKDAYMAAHPEAES